MKKFIALFSAVVMVILCTSCSKIMITVPEKYIPGFLFNGNGGQPVVNTDNNVTAQPVATEGDTAVAASTDPAAESTSSAQGTPDATTPAAPTEAQTDKPSGGAPSTKEEIIAYYVAAYNKIATDSKKIVRNYDNTTQYNDILNVNGNGTLESLAKTLMNQFMKPTEEDIEFGIADLPPKGVSTLTITPAQISSATCVDNGSTYTITLKSTGTDANYELDAQPGKDSAGVIGPLLRTEDVTGAAGSAIAFEGLHAKYATCTVVATVDKASGHITNFDFNSPCILHFDQVTAMKIVKVQNCDIGLLFLQKWTISY